MFLISFLRRWTVYGTHLHPVAVRGRWPKLSPASPSTTSLLMNWSFFRRSCWPDPDRGAVDLLPAVSGRQAVVTGNELQKYWCGC